MHANESRTEELVMVLLMSHSHDPELLDRVVLILYFMVAEISQQLNESGPEGGS